VDAGLLHGRGRRQQGVRADQGDGPERPEGAACAAVGEHRCRDRLPVRAARGRRAGAAGVRHLGRRAVAGDVPRVLPALPHPHRARTAARRRRGAHAADPVRQGQRALPGGAGRQRLRGTGRRLDRDARGSGPPHRRQGRAAGQPRPRDAVRFTAGDPRAGARRAGQPCCRQRWLARGPRVQPRPRHVAGHGSGTRRRAGRSRPHRKQEKPDVIRARPLSAFPMSILCFLLLAFALPATAQQAPAADYFDNTGRQDVLSGGVRMIPITTPQGEFRVWTKRVGNNPTIKVLLLHGGPGATHEYFEGFDSFLPGAGVEYYYYDQLGSAYSDQPDDMTPFLSIDHYVEEVEQVRQALGLDSSNFYLLGNSWGGLLAIEYALK